mmetsp:Transcript_112811/g.205040  ORF Transcript_112811/g.205040 Transcript_112811/m.205040 type:complete len:85 (-) Transcript_112811:40-294(-)
MRSAGALNTRQRLMIRVCLPLAIASWFPENGLAPEENSETIICTSDWTSELSACAQPALSWGAPHRSRHSAFVVTLAYSFLLLH